MSVTLPSATTAGNTLICVLVSFINLTGAPAEWAVDKSMTVVGNLYVFRGSETVGGETSWNLTFGVLGSDASFNWYVAELSGVGSVEPLDASVTSGASPVSLPNGGTISTGTAPLNASLNTVVIAVFDADKLSPNDVASWGSYTGGFEEVADVGGSGGVIGHQLGVARKFVTGATDQFSCTATFTTSGGTASGQALLVAYRAADSPIAAPLAMFAGYDWLTHGGMNSHNGATNMLSTPLTPGGGTWGTSYLIQAGSARNSAGGLRVVQAGAAGYVQHGNLTGAGFSFGFDVRVVSASGTVIVAQFATALYLLYDATNSKFGVRAGATGTVSWQSGTTATNTWVWVDLRVKVSTSTWRVEWRLETAADTYTAQTAAELTGQAAGVSTQTLIFGHTAAQTMTADYDNACCSLYYVAYPLTPHQVRLLTVDTAGTPTVSGTSSNFSVFTANGTLAAWNATNARNAVDEVPPTVSASADGVCQTAVAASDYMEFPMAAATVADDEVIDGVRMLVPAWGGTGTGTGTLGLRGWDGTTETTLIPASTSYDAGSPTVISTTEPRWQCAMWQWPTGGWTKTRLDGVSLRVGFSTDATPDMGVHSLYLEYATRKARSQTIFGDSSDVQVDAAIDPNTEGVRALNATTPVGRGTALTYEVSGTPSTLSVAGGDTDGVVIDAPDAPTVGYVKIETQP